MLDWTVQWSSGATRKVSELSNGALSMVETFLRNGLATVQAPDTLESALHRIEIERVARRRG